MASIDQYLEEIEVASRGEEVRDSIIDALEALNSEGPGTMDWDNITDTPDTLTGYGVSDVPASMVSGVLALNNIPPSALERVVPVADDTARFALTSSDVQNGDTVKVLSTLKLYLVVDDTSLSTEAGYEEYKAGTADSVDWSGVLNTPDTLAGYGIEDAYTKDEVDDITTSEEVESEAGNPIVIETDAAQYAKKTHLTLEPVQDLHGYDHPWPAGGGKNLCPPISINDNVSSITYASLFVGDGNFTFSTTTPKNNNDSANLFLFSGQVSSGASTNENGVWLGQSRTVSSQNGYITYAYRSVDGVNPKNYNNQIESGSTATTFAPYSNICPITPMGHRNLLPMTVEGIKAANTVGVWSGNTYAIYGLTFELEVDGDGNVIGIKVNGTASVAISFWFQSPTAKFSVEKGSILTGCPSGGSDSTYGWGVSGYSWDYGNGTVMVYNATSRAAIWVNANVAINNLVFKPMLRPASDPDSTFVPYGVARVGAKITGFNQWDEEWESGGYNSNTGAKVADTSFFRSKNLIPIRPNTVYYFKCPTTYSAYARFVYYDESKNKVGYIGTRDAMNTTFITPDNAWYMVFWTGENLSTPTYNHDICINISDTEKNGTYEPYKGYMASLDLPEPVYSGTLDLETGVVVADMGIVDLGTLTWTYDGAFTAVVPEIAKNPYTSDALICSEYPTTPLPYSQFTYGIRFVGGTSSVAIKDPSYTDATTFKTAMSGVQLCYELATPKTYQLTPQQLALLKGTNVISTNAKTVRVTYRNGELATTGDIVASTEVAKQNAIGEAANYTDARLATELAPILGNFATAETSPTSASHAVGEYLLYNNRLYKVLAAISAGQQLTIGTNIGQTNVAAELASQANMISVLNSKLSIEGVAQKLTATSNNNTGDTCFFIFDRSDEIRYKISFGTSKLLFQKYENDTWTTVWEK